jgi:MoxR-like ATPase
MVLATQNPLEQEGTFHLPEAQLDRFLLKTLVSYPSPKEEKQILMQAVPREAQNIEKIF